MRARTRRAATRSPLRCQRALHAFEHGVCFDEAGDGERRQDAAVGCDKGDPRQTDDAVFAHQLLDLGRLFRGVDAHGDEALGELDDAWVREGEALELFARDAPVGGEIDHERLAFALGLARRLGF